MEDSPQIFWSGRQVVEEQLPQVPFWIHPILPKTGIVLLYGKFGSYKTPLSIHLAQSLAQGSPFLGLDVPEACRVLYIEGDTPRPGLWARIQKMNPDTDQLDFAFVYPGFNCVQPKAGERNSVICKALADRHKANPYGLVVIDSLRTSHMLPDKDSEVPSMVYGSLANLFPHACIFLIHHDRKSKVPDGGKFRKFSEPDEELENESFSGSQAWIDRATTSLKIKKGYSKDRQWITLHQTKSQVGEILKPLPIHIEEGCKFSLTPEITDEELIAALSSISKPKGKFDLDEKLAAFFNVPSKLISQRRETWEHAHGHNLSQLMP